MYSGYAKPPRKFFINCVSNNNGFVLEPDLAISKRKLFIAVFTTIQWKKLARLAEPMLLTLTLLMGTLLGNAGWLLQRPGMYNLFAIGSGITNLDFMLTHQ